MSVVQVTYFLPDDNYEYKMAMKALDYHSALWDFDQRLRHIVKYEDTGDEAKAEYAQEFRDLLWDYCQEYRINLDEWD